MSESFATVEEYEAYCARRRSETIEQFRQWCRNMGLQPRRCDGGDGCGYGELCRGWRLYDVDEETA